MKKIIAMLLCLVFVLSFAACGNSEEPAAETKPAAEAAAEPAASEPVEQTELIVNEPAATDEHIDRDTLNIGTTVDYGTLNCSQTGGDAFQYLLLVNEPLWDMDLDGTLTPKLAESWEWVADDHLVVHLRQGIKFSNGNPFTAEDVIFTMEQSRDSGGTQGAPRVQTTDFEKTAIIDDYTIDWYLSGNTLIHNSVTCDLLMLDKESFDPEIAATAPIGTGPYLCTDYVVNSYINFVARDDYWGEQPTIKNISYKVLTESSQRMNALETGLVDVCPVALTDVDYAMSLDGMQMYSRAGSNWLAMGFNISADGKLADPEARYAIMAAIDKQAICDLVYYGKAYAMDTPFTKANFDHSEKYEGLGPYGTGYDLEYAKELAEKTGLAGQTIVLANNGSTEHVAAAEMVQAMLAEIGVTVTIQSYDTASFTSVQQDKTLYDITLRNGMSPNLYIGDNFNNAVKNNAIWKLPENWANGNGDRYFEIASLSLSEPDEAKRNEYVEELMGYYVETSPTFALCGFNTFYAISGDLDLSNFRERAMGVCPYYGYEFCFR